MVAVHGRTGRANAAAVVGASIGPFAYGSIMTRPCCILLLLATLAATGCGGSVDQSADGTINDVVQTAAPDRPGPAPGSVAKLRADLSLRPDQGQFQKAGGRIVIADLSGVPLKSIEPLRGLPLAKLAISGTSVSSLQPLQGATLELLYANGCPIESLAGLEQTATDQLNLIDCPVRSLKPLATARLGTLWLRNCPVEDLAPLTSTGLVSLDVQNTPVTDLLPLSGMSTLRRLNIAETEVRDLSPLAGLQLQRLIFTPGRVIAGIDAIRSMASLEAIDTSFDGDQPVAMPAAEFWRRYDAGDFNDATVGPDSIGE